MNYLFGKGPELTMLQMSVRAFVTFLILLVLIRIAGRRTFAKRSAFDSIITIMLGAIIARGVVGASPYVPTIVASGVMVVMHRIIAWLCVRNKKFELLVKGIYMKLYQDGALIGNNLEKTGMSENDLHESLRLETKKITLAEIDTAFMETNGRISFILKEKEKDRMAV
ncbi:MAG TPA: YetF domain-containing protein [Parafilimonas sp.]|nr:YetF domain-containing protein [Parafilimonas sp.]